MLKWGPWGWHACSPNHGKVLDSLYNKYPLVWIGCNCLPYQDYRCCWKAVWSKSKQGVCEDSTCGSALKRKPMWTDWTFHESGAYKRRCLRQDERAAFLEWFCLESHMVELRYNDSGHLLILLCNENGRPHMATRCARSFV